MMGPHHAACGAAAWVLVAADHRVPIRPPAGVEVPVLEAATAGLPETLPLGFGMLDGITDLGVLAGAVVAAGAALLPDADHHNASIAHSLPPVSEWLCRVIGRISGGHRNGTHSVLGVAAFMLVAWLLSRLSLPAESGTLQIGAGAMTVVLASFAVRTLHFLPEAARKAPWLLGLLLGGLVVVGLGEQGWWFVLAVGLGAAVHIAGDMLTDGGCNLLWPVALTPPKSFRRLPVLGALWSSGGRMALPLLGRSGSAREWIVAVAVSVVAAVGMLTALVAALGEGARLLLAR